jgi:alkane 1-monooxygenase
MRYGLAALYYFGLVPLLELVVGPSPPLHGREPELPVKDGTVHTLRDSPSFRTVLFVHTLLSFPALLLAVSMLADPQRAPRAVHQYLLHLLSTGAVGVQLLVAGHELIHKVDRHSRIERSLGWFTMSVMLNPAYGVDHHYHHIYVGTERDSATARRGQTVFAFFVRMEASSWGHAFQAAAAKSRTQHMLPFVSGCDRFVTGVSTGCLLVLCVLAAFGKGAAIFYVAAAAVSTFFLDAANYIEHYGLQRRSKANGEVEPITLRHSWDSTHAVTNLVAWQAGGHAAHHMHGSLPYPELDIGAGPLYPYGIVTMCIVSLLPPLFFRIAHPILDQIAS